jgi:acyl-homoserine-lactone acylase
MRLRGFSGLVIFLLLTVFSIARNSDWNHIILENVVDRTFSRFSDSIPVGDVINVQGRSTTDRAAKISPARTVERNLTLEEKEPTSQLAGIVDPHAPSPEHLAAQVTIYRDTDGTPHVFGRTDVSTIFGFAYAQAEDNFPQIEEDFVLALGRGAELYGPDQVAEDRLNRALQIEDFAKDDYRAIGHKMQALCDAFAAGINYYLRQHTKVHPRLLDSVEPWYPLAFIRYSYYQTGFARDSKLGDTSLANHNLHSYAFQSGSNAWVISPIRSATKHAMLFIDPHLSFFGPAQVYEGHIHSDEGWAFSGYARFGFPFPYVGHNAYIGWASTDNAADSVDGYIENFDDPAEPLAYRYGSGHKLAKEHLETIRVKTSAGIETRSFRMVRTHHGPIFTSFDGKPVAARLPKYESHGWMREWYNMTKAENLQGLKAALSALDMLFGNVMSADKDGNIFFVYNAAVPRRNPSFDWSKPVDGSDSRTESRGYYSLAELPQLTNPSSGWMENCNTSPFLLTSSGNPDPRNFPRYMVREGQILSSDGGNNPRGRASRRILQLNSSFDFDQWSAAAFDTHVITADEVLRDWLTMVRKVDLSPGPNAEAFRAALAELDRWDHRSTVGSVPMTLFSLWRRAMHHQDVSPEMLRRTLQKVLADLTERFGHWQVPYGEINRLQRSTAFSKPPFGLPSFGDEEPSLPTAAVSANDGAAFTMRTVPGTHSAPQYGVHGDTYVSVVEFGRHTRARSIMTFGESGDPNSKHFFDQAPLYAAGKFKYSWFTREEVKRHSEAAYHPGQESLRRRHSD